MWWRWLRSVCGLIPSALAIRGASFPAANIRKIRAWRALTTRDKTRITRRARRRRTSLRDYHPDG